ncbi:ABC transporter ATP-binding protein [Phytoactinopolyspora alkaliphila]|uniref:ABC transporter ATP-binding protein n=1 Tax=Phytoactinopolyspora alkaliphila TaxID=1783498 RepID=A0A6N9YHD5_9ACTN|nr:ABC transporter ATP-binding protein [Phytoactinopolyspora alkaliphila]
MTTNSTSTADPAVSVENVSVSYRTTFEKVPTFRSAVRRLGRGQRVVHLVEALREVSFEVNHGTSIGIIGANGAGKSTLMRAIAGILPPSEGRIEVHGRVSTLLALGVGFNRKLSGRENVVLGGLAAGMTREELNERYEEIADFAELGEFIDMPMQTYSSGMSARLAFSVAVHLNPDILLIDEALSTGDAKFKQKAARKMREVAENAGTMFLVSHAMRSVKRLCNEALWLHKGQLMMQGDPTEVIAAYTKFLEVGEDAFSLEDM